MTTKGGRNGGAGEVLFLSGRAENVLCSMEGCFVEAAFSVWDKQKNAEENVEKKYDKWSIFQPKSAVTFDEVLTAWLLEHFTFFQGVLQGYTSSPILFQVCVSTICR